MTATISKTMTNRFVSRPCKSPASGTLQISRRAGDTLGQTCFARATRRNERPGGFIVCFVLSFFANQTSPLRAFFAQAASRSRDRGVLTCVIRPETFSLEASASSWRFLVQHAASESRPCSRRTMLITSSTSSWSTTEAPLGNMSNGAAGGISREAAANTLRVAPVEQRVQYKGFKAARCSVVACTRGNAASRKCRFSACVGKVYQRS